MTSPRMILPGVYEICLRTSEQRFFLKASAPVNQIVQYLLAHYAQRHAVQLLCFVVMSNHIHILVEDPHCNVPNFMRDFAAMSARALNSVLGRRESFWARKGYSLMRILRPQDFLDRVRYFYANPRRAGITPRISSYEGAWSAPMLLRTPRRIARPTTFFRATGPLPPSASLSIAPPAWFSGLSMCEYEELLEKQVARAHPNHQVLRVKPGTTTRKKQNPTSRRQPAPQAERSPIVLCGDAELRHQYLELLRHFREKYRSARAAWCRSEEHKPLFPLGTWQMHRTFGCSIDPRGEELIAPFTSGNADRGRLLDANEIYELSVS